VLCGVVCFGRSLAQEERDKNQVVHFLVGHFGNEQDDPDNDQDKKDDGHGRVQHLASFAHV
jgi:hypothetical protein